MRTPRFIPFALAAVALLTPAAGNAQGISLAAGAGYYTLSGDFDADPGLGIDGVFRVSVKPNFQLGVAVQRNSHYLGLIDDNITVLGVMAEPRYRIPLKGSSLRPFVGGRIGWVHESASRDGFEASANGFTAGAMGGLDIPLSPGVAVETAVLIQHVSMGEIKLDGEYLEDSAQSGMAVGLRVALSVALGGGR